MSTDSLPVNHATCFFCGCAITPSAKQNDHFPIPARHGGTATVTSCISCHDMKDRLDVGEWGDEWIATLVDDFSRVSRETRILLAKYVCTVLDARKLLEERKRLCMDELLSASDLAEILAKAPHGSMFGPNERGRLMVFGKDYTEIGSLYKDDSGKLFLSAD